MNPSTQPYQPGELPPVPPAFPGDAAAASLTAEQVQALRNRNYLRADSYTRADSYGRQDSGLSFYEYQIGDGDESPGSLSTATGYLSPRTPITLTPIITPSSPVPPGETPAYLRQLRRSRAERLPVRRRAPQGRRHGPMPEVSRGRDGRRQSEPRPHRRAAAEPPVVIPFPDVACTYCRAEAWPDPRDKNVCILTTYPAANRRSKSAHN